MHKRPQCDAVDLSCDLSTFVGCMSCIQSSAGLFYSCIRQKQQDNLLKTRLHVMLSHSICVLYHQKIPAAAACRQMRTDTGSARQQHSRAAAHGMQAAPQLQTGGIRLLLQSARGGWQGSRSHPWHP